MRHTEKIFVAIDQLCKLSSSNGTNDGVSNVWCNAEDLEMVVNKYGVTESKINNIMGERLKIRKK